MSERLQPDKIRKLARDIRLASLRMTSKGGSSHIGSVFSSVEILACLYGSVMRVHPAEPDWPERDRFVMSKGHAAAGLYATLALRGFFPRKRLEQFCVDDGTLVGHVTHKDVPGVEVSTGALGHGLALAPRQAMTNDERGNGERGKPQLAVTCPQFMYQLL